tara:strand:- start:45 stop:1235 length:1191 start_codon:yes stop_codon:yes gene_type:complete
LEKKYFFIIFSITTLLSINSEVFGETNEEMEITEYYSFNDSETIGEKINTNNLIFELSRDYTVHVKHVINQQTWDLDAPKLIKIIDGEHSNLIVRDEDGDKVQYGFVGETFEESEYIILAQKPFDKIDIIAEYDLENFLEYNDGLWKSMMQYDRDLVILIDKDIETVFVNSFPVDVREANGFNCKQCNSIIEYFDEMNSIKKTVTVNENEFGEISSDGEEFTLEFFSDGDINNIDFIKELNSVKFIVEKNEQLISVKIPMNLILSPYEVYLTEFGEEDLIEKNRIKKTEFGQTNEYTNLSFRPITEGIIHVVGSTQMEHEEFMKDMQVKVSEQSIEKNVEIKSVDEVKTSLDEMYKNWDSNKVVEEEEGSTSIYIIIGIIAIVALIIGIIFKLKRN